MSTWGTDRVVSCGVPSNSFVLGASVVFVELVLFYDLSHIVFTSIHDVRFIVLSYPTSSGDADGKLSMTIKMFASYIRRNDCTLSTYFTMQVFP